MTTRHLLPNGTPVQAAGETTAHRAVVVLQEAFGVNDHIREVTQRFAAQGYYAVAPELFHRNGSPEVSYDNFPEAMRSLSTLTHEGLREDLAATTEYLHSNGFNVPSIGSVGYCMGGSVSLFASTLGVVGAAVSFYGGGVATGRFGLPSLLDLAPSLQCAWLGFYGDLDASIPIEQVEALRSATALSSFTAEVIRYPDAQHGFNCDGRPAVFNETASRDATRRTYDFLAQNLVAK